MDISEIVGVYDADGGLLGEAAYVWGKVRGTRHCGLCDITHATVRRKVEWDRMVETLPVRVRLLHLNELDDELAAVVAATRAPVVLARDGGAWREPGRRAGARRDGRLGRCVRGRGPRPARRRRRGLTHDTGSPVGRGYRSADPSAASGSSARSRKPTTRRSQSSGAVRRLRVCPAPGTVQTSTPVLSPAMKSAASGSVSTEPAATSRNAVGSRRPAAASTASRRDSGAGASVRRSTTP
ncbi:hypothetical protein ACNKF0_17895 [Nocardioides sp. T5]|uniref:hypothetical protein n=1 Tax=Nocardioides sp. T5 TaxID=3400182 RepID=UPI003A89F8E9